MNATHVDREEDEVSSEAEASRLNVNMKILDEKIEKSFLMLAELQ